MPASQPQECQNGASLSPRLIAGVAAGQQWRFDACIGVIGVSLLGSMPISSCLKLEWHGLQCSVSNSSNSRSNNSSSQGGASSPAASEASAGCCGSSTSGAPKLLAGQVSCRHVTVHVLQPHVRPPSALATPFAAAAGTYNTRCVAAALARC